MSEKPTYEELEKRVQELEHVELDRKQTEEELAQIFSMSLDMICIADINTFTFIKVNPAFTEILGHSEEAFLAKPFLDFIHPDDIDATRNAIERQLQSGAKIINFENRYRCMDESYRWLSWVSHPNPEKGVTYAIARDITEWKENEEKLKKSKALLDATGRMAKVGGWELDAGTKEVTWTDETYRIHDVQPGHKPPLQEAINFFHPEDRPKLEQAIQRSLDYGEPYDMEIQFITARGKHLWTRTICEPQIVEGKTVKLKGTFQDITDRKMAEMALQESKNKIKKLNETLEQRVSERTAELESRTQQLQQLALELSDAEDRERRNIASILHDDLQQQLAYIKMEVCLLEKTADPETGQRLRNIEGLLGDSIRKSCDLSYEINPPALSRNGLLAALNVLAMDLQSRHGFTVRIHSQAEAEPDSHTLAVILYRAAKELLINVVKHAGVDSAELDILCENRIIYIRVKDSGRGFDYQAAKSSQGKGMGFGLYNIEDRITFLGGFIKVETSAGKGCCVELAVPKDVSKKTFGSSLMVGGIADQQEATGDESAQAAQQLGIHIPIRVLLADDHHMMREALSKLLQGCENLAVVGQAVNGREAVQLADQLKPDVILMDVTMPELDGFEATAEITRNNPTIRIIGLSMHNDTDTRNKMLEAGASAYLTKCGSPSTLIDTINRVYAEIT